MRNPSRSLRAALLVAAGAFSLCLAFAASAVTIDWVNVGGPGNAADPDTGFGDVAETYRISKTEITNAQYAEFLNAVAVADPNDLYHTSMGASSLGGITRSGSSGSFSYGVKVGDADKPVNFVSFWDTIRFANWLHNGQPIGAQGNATTEDGAYTITAQGISNNSITRNPEATIFLPSEDEWYKAAYYDAVSTSYFDYPAGSDTQTTCAAPTATPNRANCANFGDLTDVGSYTGSASPAGTFDQGGNVSEWNETIDGLGRVVRGGAFQSFPTELAASSRIVGFPPNESGGHGFRIASIPEPGTGLLLMTGLLGLAVRRRRRT